MPQSVLRRLRLAVARLSAGDILLQYRSAANSYKLLPTSSTPSTQDTMKQGGLSRSALVVLPVLLLLLIGGVSAGLVPRPSSSAGKSILQGTTGAQLKGVFN